MSKHSNNGGNNGRQQQAALIGESVAASNPEAIGEASQEILTAAELKIIVDDLKSENEKMRRGQAAKNRILDFLLSKIGFIHLRDLLYHLPTVCTPEEVNQCLDYMKRKMDPRDANLIESHRHDRCEEAAVRLERDKVKQEALDRLAKEG